MTQGWFQLMALTLDRPLCGKRCFSIETILIYCLRNIQNVDMSTKPTKSLRKRTTHTRELALFSKWHSFEYTNTKCAVIIFE